MAHIHYRKFATGLCIASPPNLVCVTTLPCKILTTTFFTLNSIHCCKSPVFTSVVIIANFCRMIFKVHFLYLLLLKVVKMYKHMGKVMINILQGSAVHKPY